MSTSASRTSEEEEATYDPVCIILEDLDGGLEKTTLNDIYDRRRWEISPWRGRGLQGIKLRDRASESPDSRKCVYVGWPREEIEDGVLYFRKPEDVELQRRLKEYFPVLNPENYTEDTLEFASRRFTSFINGKEYTWQYHPPDNLEMQWECIDSQGETIAYWSLKLPGEPEYFSTGCSLMICKGFEKLTLEMVATCFIIRTMQQRYHTRVEERRALEAPSQESSEETTQEPRTTAPPLSSHPGSLPPSSGGSVGERPSS